LVTPSAPRGGRRGGGIQNPETYGFSRPTLLREKESADSAPACPPAAVSGLRWARCLIKLLRRDLIDRYWLRRSPKGSFWGCRTRSRLRGARAQPRTRPRERGAPRAEPASDGRRESLTEIRAPLPFHGRNPAGEKQTCKHFRRRAQAARALSVTTLPRTGLRHAARSRAGAASEGCAGLEGREGRRSGELLSAEPRQESSSARSLVSAEPRQESSSARSLAVRRETRFPGERADEKYTIIWEKPTIIQEKSTIWGKIHNIMGKSHNNTGKSHNIGKIHNNTGEIHNNMGEIPQYYRKKPQYYGKVHNMGKSHNITWKIHNNLGKIHNIWEKSTMLWEKLTIIGGEPAGPAPELSWPRRARTRRRRRAAAGATAAPGALPPA